MSSSATTPKKSASAQQSAIHVMVATPAYGSMVHTDYLQSLLRLGYAGVPFSLLTIGNESLVTRARNSLLSRFHHDQRSTHLLFLDADVGLPPEGLKAMLAEGCDVIGAPVALKGRTPQGDRIFNFGPLIGERGNCWLTQHIGTAAFMLSRRAVNALVEDAKSDGRVYQRPSTFEGEPGPPLHYDIFQVGVVEGIYLSEDYWVCRSLRKLGFDIHVLPEVPTRHHGVVSV